jgi:hypothetical protein
MDCVSKNGECVIGLNTFEKIRVFTVFPDNLETGYPQQQIWAVSILFLLRLSEEGKLSGNRLYQAKN